VDVDIGCNYVTDAIVPRVNVLRNKGNTLAALLLPVQAHTVAVQSIVLTSELHSIPQYLITAVDVLCYLTDRRLCESSELLLAEYRTFDTFVSPAQDLHAGVSCCELEEGLRIHQCFMRQKELESDRWLCGFALRAVSHRDTHRAR
jgi:hypothetical protein